MSNSETAYVAYDAHVGLMEAAGDLVLRYYDSIPSPEMERLAAALRHADMHVGLSDFKCAQQ